jgi:hypothetical protein
MGKKNKIKKPSQPRKETNLSQRIKNQVPVSSDDECPSFRFTYADKNRWTLSDWAPSELKDLIEGLKKIEKYTWGQIKSHGSKKKGQSVGTGYKQIDKFPKLPEDVPAEYAKFFSEMRIDRTKRIFGFRVNSMYYIVWFDRNHSVCPE